MAVGRRPHLTVFGSDYKTPDGTGIRDYIHVMVRARIQEKPGSRIHTQTLTDKHTYTQTFPSLSLARCIPTLKGDGKVERAGRLSWTHLQSRHAAVLMCPVHALHAKGAIENLQYHHAASLKPPLHISLMSPIQNPLLFAVNCAGLVSHPHSPQTSHPKTHSCVPCAGPVGGPPVGAGLRQGPGQPRGVLRLQPR